MKKLLLVLLLFTCSQLRAQYLGGSGFGEDDDVTSAKLLTGVAATPSSLQFVAHPANTMAYINDIAATVYVYGSNDLLFDWSGTVNLSIGANPGSGSLLGNTGFAATGGVASFSGLYINTSGSGYTLSASATGISNGTSNTFNVAAPTLVFSLQPPASITQNQAFLTRVSVTDGAGTVLTLANPSVSMSISTNPNSGTLSGTTSVTASAGVASFSNLSINNEGVGYVLQASANSAAANSNSFAILNQVAYAGGSGDGEAENTNLNTTAVGGQKLWRGGTSTDWATAGNWYPSGVPASTDAISIENNAYNNNPVLDGNRTIASVDFGGASKKIEVGAFTLTVSEEMFNADANNFVKTASTGTLKRTIANTTSFSFPIGNSAYNPVSITNNTGASDAFSVRVLDEVYYKGLSGGVSTSPRIKRTWDITKTNPNAGSGVNFVFNWNTSEATTNITALKLYQYNGTAWDKQTGTTSVSGNALTYTGYTGSFTQFAIGDDIILLPITWLDFRCEAAEDKSVRLQWRTAMEYNTRAFMVERSVEGQTYHTIGEVPAAGQSQTVRSYSFADPQPLPSGGYYRVRMEDREGNSSYSDVCNSKAPAAGNPAPLKVFPNPTDGGLYMIALEPERNFVWEVFSATGQRVAEGNSKDGQAKASLHHLSEGVYQLRVLGSGLSENHRILLRH